MKKFNQLSIPISSSRCSAYRRTQGLRNHSSGLVSMHLGRQSQGLALPYHSVFPSDTHRNLYYICTRPCRTQPWIITSFKFPDEDLWQQLCDCELWWLQQSLSPCPASPEGKQSASLLLLPYTCARALISLNRPRFMAFSSRLSQGVMKCEETAKSPVQHSTWALANFCSERQRGTTLGFGRLR